MPHYITKESRWRDQFERADQESREDGEALERAILEEPNQMKIVQLTAENVKRLKAVQITPQGNMIVLGGNNGQGKSSVIDSIMYALGGKGSICEKPIRDGETKASVVCDMGEIVVERTWTEKGSYLQVVTKDGAAYKSPQAVLDKLTSSISFDPLEFVRLTPVAQRETLRNMVGLDFTAQDASRKTFYDQRTEVNRNATLLAGQLAAKPHFPDAPAEEVSAASLMQELDAAEAHNKGIEKLNRNRDKLGADCEKALAEINRLKTLLLAAEDEYKELVDLHKKAYEAINVSVTVDVAPIREKLAKATETNKQVAANLDRATLSGKIEQLQTKAQYLTTQIEAIDAEKAKQLKEVTFPLDGLSFNESGVLLAGVPFSQASQAEQIRASVAIGLAQNPKIRVLLIRNGSLLDDDGLALVAKMAADHDAQVWVERVGKGEEINVMIEDGEVKSA